MKVQTILSSQPWFSESVSSRVFKARYNSVLRMTQGSANESHSVAVIGLACRFPGDAYNGERFWELLCKGQCMLLLQARRFYQTFSC